MPRGGGYTYSITGGNSSGYFSIDSSTRVVSVSGSTPVGTYPLTLRATNNSSSGYSEGTYTVTINKKSTTVTAPTARVLTFTGSTQQLVNAGSGEGVSFTYSLSSGSGYSPTIPSAVNCGSYTVYWAATVDSNYSTTSAKYGSVNVSIAVNDSASISFASDSVTKTVNASAFTNALTNTGDGTVTYSSDKPSVASVNSSNGQVTILSCDGVNCTVHITATVADTANSTYNIKNVSYTLLVTNMGTTDGNMLFRKYYNDQEWYHWNTAGAKTAVYYWDDSGHDCWSNIATEADKYDDGSGYNDYFVNPTDTTYVWTHCKFVRLNSSCTTPNWDDKWAETDTIDISSSYNCYGPTVNNQSSLDYVNKISITGITYYENQEHVYLDLYAQTNSWIANNAVIGAYFYGSNSHTSVATVQMKMVEGFENGDHSKNTSLYEAVVPEGNYTNVIFFRAADLDLSHQWNQTADLHRYANNVYKLSSMTGGVHDWDMSEDDRALCYGRYFNECIVCTGEGVDPDHDDWSGAKSEYTALGTSVKSIIRGATANPSGNDYQKAISKYDYIVFRRGYAWADDFIDRNATDGSSGSVYKGTLGLNNNNFRVLLNSEGNFEAILIIVASSISIMSITFLSVLVIKKRKNRT